MHRWDLAPAEAIALQQELRGKISTLDDYGNVTTVAGVDVGFEKRGAITRAAVAVLEYPSLAPVASAIARRPTEFPYIPGLLSFREVPAVLDALEQLSHPPDLLLCDGQGYAHPRRFGIACHLGLLTDIPSIGVGKSRLVGEHAELGLEQGAHQYLHHHNEIIGMVLRTRAGVKPVYVSSGYRVSLDSAVAFVLACIGRYRLPEPIRSAHRLASG